MSRWQKTVATLSLAAIAFAHVHDLILRAIERQRDAEIAERQAEAARRLGIDLPPSEPEYVTMGPDPLFFLRRRPLPDPPAGWSTNAGPDRRMGPMEAAGVNPDEPDPELVAMYHQGFGAGRRVNERLIEVRPK